jgi:hypothetical protein
MQVVNDDTLDELCGHVKAFAVASFEAGFDSAIGPPPHDRSK